jgi:hypothetical protein
MKVTQKLKQLILILQWLFLLLSITAIIFALIDGSKFNFDFSSQGFQAFLDLFRPYSILFTATFILIPVNLTIEKIELTRDSNKTTLKENRKTIWLQSVKEYLNEVTPENSEMIKLINKDLDNIFDYLYEIKYKFSSKSETKHFFERFFIDKIQFFEEMNSIKGQCSFNTTNEKYSLAWDTFRSAILRMIVEKDCYSGFILNLKELYIGEVKNKYKKLDIELFELLFNAQLKKMQYQDN